MITDSYTTLHSLTNAVKDYGLAGEAQGQDHAAQFLAAIEFMSLRKAAKATGLSHATIKRIRDGEWEQLNPESKGSVVEWLRDRKRVDESVSRETQTDDLDADALLNELASLSPAARRRLAGFLRALRAADTGGVEPPEP